MSHECQPVRRQWTSRIFAFSRVPANLILSEKRARWRRARTNNRICARTNCVFCQAVVVDIWHSEQLIIWQRTHRPFFDVGERKVNCIENGEKKTLTHKHIGKSRICAQKKMFSSRLYRFGEFHARRSSNCEYIFRNEMYSLSFISPVRKFKRSILDVLPVDCLFHDRFFMILMASRERWICEGKISRLIEFLKVYLKEPIFGDTISRHYNRIIF